MIYHRNYNYVNVSLEQINYKPVTLTSIYDTLEERGL